MLALHTYLHGAGAPVFATAIQANIGNNHEHRFSVIRRDVQLRVARCLCWTCRDLLRGCGTLCVLHPLEPPQGQRCAGLGVSNNKATDRPVDTTTCIAPTHRQASTAPMSDIHHYQRLSPKCSVNVLQQNHQVGDNHHHHQFFCWPFGRRRSPPFLSQLGIMTCLE